ncbi:hypothetical protein [Spiroplasma alleghenense]|uniref:N-acetylmannosamine kinase n=1 Tax=Spiroplasma alleghenense TaxID=216931 RepID=A0A345Z3A0_9MOLU|nr:hypothetical protein [Spiroplasma alleghenense]AXK51079.1 N-acetylmannosamine kinase [Spiroplasma alleghenense]
MSKDVKVVKINRQNANESFNKKYFNPLESVWYEDDFTEEFKDGVADLDQTIANFESPNPTKKPLNANAHFFQNNFQNIEENIFSKETNHNTELSEQNSQYSNNKANYFDPIHNTSLNVLGPEEIANTKTDLPKSIIELREKSFLEEMKKKKLSNQEQDFYQKIKINSEVKNKNNIQEVDFKKPFTTVIEEYDVATKVFDNGLKHVINSKSVESVSLENQSAKSEVIRENEIKNNFANSQLNTNELVVEKTTNNQGDIKSFKIQKSFKDGEKIFNNNSSSFNKDKLNSDHKNSEKFYANVKEQILEPIFHGFERVDKNDRPEFKNDAETLFNNKEIESIFEQNGKAPEVVNERFVGSKVKNDEDAINPYILPRSSSKKHYNFELNGIFVKPEKMLQSEEFKRQVIIPTRKNSVSEQEEKVYVHYNPHASEKNPAKKVLNNILIDKITNKEKTRELKINQPIINNFDQTQIIQNDDFNKAVSERKGLPTEELSFINHDSNSTTEILKSFGESLQKKSIVTDEYTSENFDDFENWFKKTRNAKKIKKIAEREHKVSQKIKK